MDKYSFVTCPDFVKKSGNEVTEIRCKVCGTLIAGVIDRPGGVKITVNGGRVERRIEKFSRFHNFTELKIGLADGNFHITTGCERCLVHNLNTAQLRELMVADIEEQRADLGNVLADRLAQRAPLAVVGIKLGGGIT